MERLASVGRLLRSRRFSAVAAVVVGAFLLGPGVRTAVTGDLPATDLKTYYLAGVKVVQGEPLYVDEDAGNRFTSPPVFALLFVPLAGFSLTTAYLVWYPFMVACWIACLVVARRLFESYYVVTWPVAVLVTVALSRTVMNHLQRGQVNLLILLMVLWAMVLAGRGRPRLAGLWAGLAAGLKIYPAFFLPYWIWKKQWVSAATMLTGWATLWGAGILLLGPTALLRWFQETVRGSLSSDLPPDFFIPYPPYSLMNQSVFAVLLRMFSSSAVTDDHGLNLLSLEGTVLRLAVFGGAATFVAVTMLTMSRDKPDSRFVEASQLHLLMLLAVPLVWKANFVFLLVPYLVLLAQLERGGPEGRLAGRVLGLSLLLQWVPKLLPEEANDVAFVLGVLAWSGLVLWIYNLWRLRRPAATLQQPQGYD